jgi:5-methylcytosine-specific restriction protein A
MGLVAIDVNSGNLHRRVGGYPGSDHRMPMCCEAMYSAMNDGDSIVSQPESGKGASVIVRYKLPRE